MKEAMSLEYDQYEKNQIWWMWMRWTMICKMSGMETNDEMNELDFGTWNE